MCSCYSFQSVFMPSRCNYRLVFFCKVDISCFPYVNVLVLGERPKIGFNSKRCCQGKHSLTQRAPCSQMHAWQASGASLQCKPLSTVCSYGCLAVGAAALGSQEHGDGDGDGYISTNHRLTGAAALAPLTQVVTNHLGVRGTLLAGTQAHTRLVT